jgi:hypothetical protein
MKGPVTPIRSTIIWGMVGGLAYIPLCLVLGRIVSWPLGFRLFVAALLAGYSVMLCRWASRTPGSIRLPLLLLLLAAFFIRSTPAFLWTAFMILGWIRSGICFKKVPFFKRFGVEICLGLAAGLPAARAVPAVAPFWALGVWLFFLIQALYFILFEYQGHHRTEIEVDPFEKAKMGVEKILSGRNY